MVSQTRDVKAVGRGTLKQQARLWSGLILLAYVTGHFVNHAMGLISLQAMEDMLLVMSAIWSSVPGTVALYGALLVHVLFAAISILSIRTLKLPFWRWMQIILGIAIPYWLASHIVVTRGSEIITDVPVTYIQELALLWPVSAIKQNALLLIVWCHGMIGLHFWLRPRRWYGLSAIFATPVVIAIPMLAIVGWIVAAQRELGRIAADPQSEAAQKLAADLARVKGAMPDYQTTAQTGVLIVLATIVVMFVLMLILRKMKRKVKVSYGGADPIDVTPGQTILEASQSAGIPHLSVCGGRARCSTCRTVVLEKPDNLSDIGPAERKLLEKINAEPNIRLACQARIMGDVDIRPIIQPKHAASTPLKSDPFAWGLEREVTIMHLKIKGFLGLVDKSPPYDAIFILNHLLDKVVDIIEEFDGQVDKFTSDGVIAIFGLEANRTTAARAALKAAAKCHAALQQPDEVITQHLQKPLEIGIGLHTGRSVIGRVGKTSDQVVPNRVSAIGNATGIAEGFEKVTEKLGARIVYSKYTHECAQLGMPEMLGSVGRIQLAGIDQTIDAVILKNGGPLQKAIDVLEKPRNYGTLETADA